MTAYIADSRYTGIGNGSDGNMAGGTSKYRYGFNGKERDDEVKGAANQIDYGMRVYDPRIARFLSIDPLASKYPWYTPYQYAGNMPVWMTDLDGAEPNPSQYLDQRLKVDLTKMPDSYTTSSGRSVVTGVRDNGIRDNAAWYWDQVRKNNPDIVWSKKNIGKLDNGYAPVADAEFIREFPIFEAFANDVMHMHHLNQMNGFGYGLPSTLHSGKGFTKLWHNTGKALAFIGAMMTLYQQTYGQDPLLVDMFVHEKLASDENMLAEYGLSQKDYSGIVTFAMGNNSRTGQMRPGTVGIYYGSEEDAANMQFLNLSQAQVGSFISGNFYPDANAASQALHKRVTFAIVFFQSKDNKGFYPVNVIQLAEPSAATPPPSTFQNKKD